MTHHLPMLVAWSARIVGWSALLSFCAYVAWNYEGIGVRVQFARLSLPSESEDALGRLLALDGLPDRLRRYDHLQVSAYRRYAWWDTVRKQPRLLGLRAESAGSTRRIFIGFDTQGRLAGVPVEVVPHLGVRFSNFASMGQFTDGTLVAVVSESPPRVPPSAAPAAPPALSYVHRVFRLGFPASPEILRVKIRTATRFLGLSAAVDEAGREGLRLERWNFPDPGRRRVPPTPITSFIWDEEAGRFVGPQGDPQGVWEADYAPQPRDADGAPDG